MRAVLLAAGLGTRLRPLTDTIPKCLVPIKGKPLLDIWCETLLAAGVEKVLVNTHYKHQVVEEHLARVSYRDQVGTVYEPELLGTAGTLIANKDFFNHQDGMLIHADNYCEANISNLIHAHKNRPSGCAMTLLAFRTSTPETCGILETDTRNILQNMYEKSKENHGNLANGAFYVLTQELIASLSTEQDFSNEVIPKYFGKVFVVETNETYLDIGSPESYALAQTISKQHKL